MAGLRPWPLQREDIPEEVTESHHSVTVAGETRVDPKHLVVTLQPDMRRREAAHSGVSVEVYSQVHGQCGEDRPELVHPFRLVVGDKKLDTAIVLTGCDVKWHDEVTHGMEEVSTAAAGREDYRRHVVPHRALRWDNETES